MRVDKVAGQQGLVKIDDAVILNIDSDALTRHKTLKKKTKVQESFGERLSALEVDIAIIKNVLLHLTKYESKE